MGKEGEHENKWKGREIGFIAAKPYPGYDIHFWGLVPIGTVACSFYSV